MSQLVGYILSLPIPYLGDTLNASSNQYLLIDIFVSFTFNVVIAIGRLLVFSGLVGNNSMVIV